MNFERCIDRQEHQICNHPIYLEFKRSFISVASQTSGPRKLCQWKDNGHPVQGILQCSGLRVLYP